MSLISLPPEVIVLVLSHLPACAIKRLAQTYNKYITAVCLTWPALIRHLLEHKNAYRMLNLFTGTTEYSLLNPWEWLSHIPKQTFHESGLEEVFGSYSAPPDHYRPCLDYLDLRDDLLWIQDTPELVEHRRGYEPPGRMQDCLETYAAALGLVVPQSFMMLVHDDARRKCIPSPAGESEFALGDRIYKIHAKDGVTGYVLRFWPDIEAWGFWYLYLDTDQGNCVLYAGEDCDLLKDHIDDATSASSDELEQELDILIMKDGAIDFILQGTSFESWLALTYLQSWSTFLFEYDKARWDTVPMALVVYVVGVFTEDGRKAAERGMVPVVYTGELNRSFVGSKDMLRIALGSASDHVSS